MPNSRKRVDEDIGKSYVDTHYYILEGYKARRKSWPPQVYIYLERGKLCSAERGQPPKLGISHDLYDYVNTVSYSVMPQIREHYGKFSRVWRPTMICLLSCDWVVLNSDKDETTISVELLNPGG